MTDKHFFTAAYLLHHYCAVIPPLHLTLLQHLPANCLHSGDTLCPVLCVASLLLLCGAALLPTEGGREAVALWLLHSLTLLILHHVADRLLHESTLHPTLWLAGAVLPQPVWRPEQGAGAVLAGEGGEEGEKEERSVHGGSSYS